MRSTRSRLLFAAVLLILLAGSPARSEAAPWSGFWSWLAAWTGLGPAAPSGAAGSTDDGPLIDPDGRGQITRTTAGADVGPAIDPDGGDNTTAAPSGADVGPMIDPNGGGH
jgi:hypothetical protein